MTNEQQQSEWTEQAGDAAREPIRAPEASHTGHGVQHVAPAIPAHAKTPDAPTPAPAPEKSPERGNWFHRNRWFTKEPVTYTAYQFFRSAMAAIPYGPAMAFGHHLFGAMSVKGQKAGLTAEGIKTFASGGLPTLEAAAHASEAARNIYFKPGTAALMARNMMRVANSPLNAAVQIAMGFTLFRFTGGVIKNLRDRVMNEKNTPEETNRETRNTGKTIWQTAKNNWPAESTGTPIAALVLGYMSAVFTPPVALLQRNKAAHPGWSGYGAQVKEAWSHKSKLLQNGAVWTFSYSLFFLMAESLFKDVQLRRGLWKGHPNSLKNGPDDTVGGPGAPNYKTPENDIAVKRSAEDGYAPSDRATDSEHKLRYPMLTGEPSPGRFIFRRVLPVAIGITAYAALKRAGYLALGGTMKPVSVKQWDELKSVGDHLKFWGENARREGGATAMFGALWMATDAWGTWYDKFVHHLQKKENEVELNPRQQQKHAELLDRVNAKELGASRAKGCAAT